MLVSRVSAFRLSLRDVHEQRDIIVASAVADHAHRDIAERIDNLSLETAILPLRDPPTTQMITISRSTVTVPNFLRSSRIAGRLRSLSIVTETHLLQRSKQSCRSTCGGGSRISQTPCAGIRRPKHAAARDLDCRDVVFGGNPP